MAGGVAGDFFGAPTGVTIVFGGGLLGEAAAASSRPGGTIGDVI